MDEVFGGNCGDWGKSVGCRCLGLKVLSVYMKTKGKTVLLEARSAPTLRMLVSPFGHSQANMAPQESGPNQTGRLATAGRGTRQDGSGRCQSTLPTGRLG